LAEIQEYLPQTEQSGPVGDISPNIELAAAPGRAIEGIGREASDVGSKIEARQYQQDVADTYANFADQRANWMERISQETQNQTLDPDKLLDEYDQTTNDMQDQLSTPQGKNFFVRQQARLRGAIQQRMAIGSAAIAGANAQASWKVGSDRLGNSVYNDPNSFDDAIGHVHEGTSAYVDSGLLPAKSRARAVQEIGTNLAQDAILGMAKDNPTHARQMLDSDKFDAYLSPEQKISLLGQIKTIQRGQQADYENNYHLQQEQQRVRDQNWEQKNYASIVDGTMTTSQIASDVTSGKISAERADHWQGALERFAKRSNDSNPYVKADLYRRMLPGSDNPITELSDILPHAQNGDINEKDFKDFAKTLDPTGVQLMQLMATKQLIQKADNHINFDNHLTGQLDEKGVSNSNQFISDLVSKAVQVRQNGGDPHDVVNPKSQNYFGTPENLANYAMSPSEQLDYQRTDRVKKALGLNQGASPVPEAKSPNESIDDFFARMDNGKAPPKSRQQEASDDFDFVKDQAAKIFQTTPEQKALEDKIKASAAAEMKRRKAAQ